MKIQLNYLHPLVVKHNLLGFQNIFSKWAFCSGMGPMLLNFVFSHFGESRRFMKGFGFIEQYFKTGLKSSKSDLHINFSLCKMEMITPTSSVTVRTQGENAYTCLADTQ